MSRLLDRFSEFLARRKGLLPLTGAGMIALNLVLQLVPGGGWVISSNLFLHVGAITAIVGLLLGWAL